MRGFGRGDQGGVGDHGVAVIDRARYKIARLIDLR
jgi:hypothetical protein